MFPPSTPLNKGSVSSKASKAGPTIPVFSVGEQSSALTPSSERVYGFQLGQFNFLLEKGTPAEIIAQPQFNPMPNCPDHILGLVNVRGTIVPAYSLLPFLGHNERHTEPFKYGLMVGKSSRSVLIAMLEKPTAIDVQLLSLNNLSKDYPTRIDTFIKKSYSYAQGQWNMLDTQGLFSFLASTNSRAFD